MAHLLAPETRNEFLAVPQCVRLLLCPDIDGGGEEPTLLIRADTLTIVEATSRNVFDLLVLDVGAGRLAYAVDIGTGEDQVRLWSPVEGPMELNALGRLFESTDVPTFFFNELVINAGYARLSVRGARLPAHTLSDRVAAPVSGDDLAKMSTVLRGSAPTLGQLTLTDGEWISTNAGYYPSGDRALDLNFLNDEAGERQEVLAQWLLDSLGGDVRATRGPQIPTSDDRRKELTDILLAYDSGIFLIESKALAMKVEDPPSRAQLSRRIEKAVNKALRQLSGAWRSVLRGVPISSALGNAIELPAGVPPHAIVLVPDIDLLDSRTFDGAYLRQACTDLNGIVHLLDLTELLRLVQGAESLAEAYQAPRIAAFDNLLIERAKVAVQADRAAPRMLFR